MSTLAGIFRKSDESPKRTTRDSGMQTCFFTDSRPWQCKSTECARDAKISHDANVSGFGNFL